MILKGAMERSRKRVNISGVFIDSTGDKPQGVPILIGRKQAGTGRYINSINRNIVTSEDGVYTINNLPVGEYTISAIYSSEQHTVFRQDIVITESTPSTYSVGHCPAEYSIPGDTRAPHYFYFPDILDSNNNIVWNGGVNRAFALTAPNNYGAAANLAGGWQFQYSGGGVNSTQTTLIVDNATAQYIDLYSTPYPIYLSLWDNANVEFLKWTGWNASTNTITVERGQLTGTSYDFSSSSVMLEFNGYLNEPNATGVTWYYGSTVDTTTAPNESVQKASGIISPFDYYKDSSTGKLYHGVTGEIAPSIFDNATFRTHGTWAGAKWSISDPIPTLPWRVREIEVISEFGITSTTEVYETPDGVTWDWYPWLSSKCDGNFARASNTSSTSINSAIAALSDPTDRYSNYEYIIAFSPYVNKDAVIVNFLIQPRIQDFITYGLSLVQAREAVLQESITFGYSSPNDEMIISAKRDMYNFVLHESLTIKPPFKVLKIRGLTTDYKIVGNEPVAIVKEGEDWKILNKFGTSSFDTTDFKNSCSNCLSHDTREWK